MSRCSFLRHRTQHRKINILKCGKGFWVAHLKLRTSPNWELAWCSAALCFLWRYILWDMFLWIFILFMKVVVHLPPFTEIGTSIYGSAPRFLWLDLLPAHCLCLGGQTSHSSPDPGHALCIEKLSAFLTWNWLWVISYAEFILLDKLCAIGESSVPFKESFICLLTAVNLREDNKINLCHKVSLLLPQILWLLPLKFSDALQDLWGQGYSFNSPLVSWIPGFPSFPQGLAFK